MHLKKYLFIAIVGTLGYQTSSAQTETDAMPAKPAAERIVNEVQSVVDMATVSEVNRNASYASASNFKGESIVKTALQYLGAKYRSGHSGPNAFDCSGLTSFVYGKKASPSAARQEHNIRRARQSPILRASRKATSCSSEVRGPAALSDTLVS